MTHLLTGLIICISCLTGYFFSWKYHVKQNYKVALALLILCGLILRFYSSCDFFIHSWDERYHALVAKNLMGHMLVPTLYDNPVFPLEPVTWKTSHIWLHKQPLPLWTMALSMMVFGVNEIAIRIPSILFTSAGIGLTFYIARYLFNNRVAYIAAFFYSINGLIIEMTGGRVATDHIDVFFLFFVELAVFFTVVFIQRKKSIFNILTGICIGAAILCKWLPAMIVLPVWLLLVADSRAFSKKKVLAQFALVLIFTIIVFVPWQLYIHCYFPLEAKIASDFNMRHITEALDGMDGPFYYFIDKMRINYGELIYLPLGWFSWQLLKKRPLDLKRLSVFTWFLVPLIFFSIVKTKMQGYILFVSPALFIISADFWVMLSGYCANRRFKWFFNLVLIAMIALPVRYAIERTKMFAPRNRKPLWAKELKALNEKKIRNGVLVNYPRPVEAMFYTDLVVYETLPGRNAISDLISKGYTVIVNDNGLVPDDYYTIKGLNFRKFAPPEIGLEQ
ncbi:MAG TPA: glycosyltransferase family 39 protein [Bacteroidia bacterium]